MQGFNGPVHVYPMPFLTEHSYIYSAWMFSSFLLFFFSRRYDRRKENLEKAQSELVLSQIKLYILKYRDLSSIFIETLIRIFLNSLATLPEMYVSTQECWSYIGRYRWAHGTGGSIDKSSAVNAFDFAWVIPWTLTVYDQSHSMSSHGIKKVSD